MEGENKSDCVFNQVDVSSRTFLGSGLSLISWAVVCGIVPACLNCTRGAKIYFNPAHQR